MKSYNTLFYVAGFSYIVLAALIFFLPLPDADAKKEKKEGLMQNIKATHFSIESIAMILIGFTTTGTFQLWLNCAQNFAKDVVGWADPSKMQTYYSLGTFLALIAVYLVRAQTLCIVGAFLIGWAGAGGLLQIATSVCNMIFPKIKGTVTALVMIASSLCNYTLLTAAAKMSPSGVMMMNIILTAVGVLLGLFVNMRYSKMVEVSQE